MAVNFRGKTNKRLAMQQAADRANRRSGQGFQRSGESNGIEAAPIDSTLIGGICFDGGGIPGVTAIGIDGQVSGQVDVSDVTIVGVHTGIAVDDRSDDFRGEEKEAMKINVSGGSNITGDHAGISVPQGSTAEIDVKENSAIAGGTYGIEERDAVVAALRDVLPQDTPTDVIQDAIDAVRAAKDGTDDERKSAVQSSRLMEWIKDNGPDLVGVVIRAIAAASS
ncbi:hypothetical protein KEC55_07815 [Burkholderia cepacia]|uniref:hypothetical protein n=1 Tax=Burkholderia cepacia TaxID=292 RepID=UPI00249F5483|nr:hypothetical protein [Burkholderia cepacia]WGY69862.1 hypothetical protein KEC55_07815 [Burkholderia cepacia]